MMKRVVIALAMISMSSTMLAPKFTHGFGFIERIRNESEYPVSVFFEKTIHDELPENTTVRIKSLRSSYEDGRYFAVRKHFGSWRMVADTDRKDDPATLYTVSRYVTKHLVDCVGFYSNTAGSKFMNTDDVRHVFFKGERIKGEDYKNAHWTIDGPTLENCSLKSRVSGYLNARGTGQTQMTGEKTSKFQKTSRASKIHGTGKAKK